MSIRKSELAYKSGYKYQVVQDCSFQLPEEFHGYGFNNEWILLKASGTITAIAGYAWDGPSGPTIDTPDFMAGSLLHDMLYQLFGLGTLPIALREAADKLLVAVCAEDGMPAIRRAWVFAGVRIGGAKAARQGDKVETIPVKG